MILPSQQLEKRHFDLIEHPHPQLDLINPASIDIRIGNDLMIEVYSEYLPLFINRLLRPISFLLPKRKFPKYLKLNLRDYDADNPFYFYPGECILVSSMENLLVPEDLVMDLRLKSSRARELYDHSLAFWFDPGWRGIGTMELKNISTFAKLPVYPGLKIAQIIYNTLTETCASPYKGKYKYAAGVESSKEPKRPNL